MVANSQTFYFKIFSLISPNSDISSERHQPGEGEPGGVQPADQRDAARQVGGGKLRKRNITGKVVIVCSGTSWAGGFTCSDRAGGTRIK